jgi:hypothetical protein
MREDGDSNPGQEVRYKNGTFPCVHSSDLLGLSQIKKSPEGTKICWHSSHPVRRDATASSSGKRFPGLFPPVARSAWLPSQGEHFEGDRSR